MKLMTITTIIIALLTGCSATKETLSYSNCTTEDWTTLGFNAAQSGKDVRTFDAVKAECGATLALDAQDKFVDGYSDGLLEYCTYELGYKHAKKGLDQSSICPNDMAIEYKKGYVIGHRERSEIEEYMARQQREMDRRKLGERRKNEK
ncbi:DUF2799 domain-containing protein [Pseudoalteromonas luteoviolacea]|uniref:DUF2799 domain-containing protein n=1 Tax=Pseudoalteromonas luteoviolacea TaxID=43657 RepID=UPI001B396F50|nr:DUF2799 domain-containing protein [Pseudoalteromonas luteoviolacea]MBQ4809918.1 DUF2799 domain-containing protein [Pseudoalteromonas luteoviolacea]